MKRLGPDLKMPNFKKGDVKVPAFLGDLFYDLRERRLLAPLALLLVAIAAVPFVLGGDSDKPAVSGGGPVVPPALGSSGAKLTVVEAKPGLRDYRKRLAGRQPTNPFKQRYTSPRVEGAELGEESSKQTTTVTTGAPTAAPPASSTAAPTSEAVPSPAPGSGGGSLTFFTWGIDVWIHKVPTEPEADDEAITKPRVLDQTPLPGKKTPVVTFMGLSREAAEEDKTQRALFVVSDEVTKVLEGGKCLSRGEGVCQLIEVNEGEAISFAYGPGETRYTIKVLKIEVVVTGRS